ncbi:MAG TPA: hypothetical protein VN667_13770, partial [Burkholderiales bacterium]|nr:hypothetical protein [Burkholderiales bacterium]
GGVAGAFEGVLGGVCAAASRLVAVPSPMALTISTNNPPDILDLKKECTIVIGLPGTGILADFRS